MKPRTIGMLTGLGIWGYDFDFFINAGGPEIPISDTICSRLGLEYCCCGRFQMLIPPLVLMICGAAIGEILSYGINKIKPLTFIKTFLQAILVYLILLTSSPAFAGGWLIYHDGPYKGKVVDAETNQPIEGAAVVAVWYLERYGGAGGPVAKFFEAKETVTDQNGEFEIPAITGFHWWPFASLDKPNLTVFKPGYTSYKWYKYPSPKLSKFPDGIIRLTKTKSREEMIKAMTDAGFADNIPTKKISNFLHTMDKEYQQLEVGISR